MWFSEWENDIDQIKVKQTVQIIKKKITLQNSIK